MVQSLKNFPTKKEKEFNPDNYSLRVQRPVFKSDKKGMIGIELEMEGTGLLRRLLTVVNGIGWAVHNEGSLRNGGLEYVLTEPCKIGDEGPLLAGIYREMTDAGTRLNLSSRCSTHVHINAAGLKINQLASVVILWAVLEDVLVNWCGEKRAGNLFCLRFSDCDTAAVRWSDAFKRGRFDFPEQYRYLALNGNALSKFGSLEFRTLRGADNPDLVLKWIECLLRLRELGEGRFRNPNNIATEFSGLGPIGFLEDVLKGLKILPEIFTANEKVGANINDLLWEGLRRAQPMIFALPWHEVIEEADKTYIPDPFNEPAKKIADIERIRMRGARPVRMGDGWAPIHLEPVLDGMGAEGADDLDPIDDEADDPEEEDEDGN